MVVIASPNPFALSSALRIAPGNPFALSLSKGCSSLRNEGQGFDKLSPNGIWMSNNG